MANTPTSFNDLFNLDDTTPIDNAIDKIENLNSVYNLLVSQAEKNSERYAESLDLIAKSAEKLEKQLLGLDTAEKSQQEATVKAAKQAEDLLNAQDKTTKLYNDERAALAMLTDAQNKLGVAKDTLNKKTILEAGSLGALKKELKEAAALYETYGDATDQAVKDETLKKIKDLSKSVAEGDKALKDAKKGVDLAAGSYNSLAVRVADAKKKLKEMEGGIGSTSKEFKDLKKFAADGTKQLKEFDDEVGDNQRNVGNYKDALNALPGPLKALAGGIEEGTKAGLAFIASPFGIVLAALAVIVGSLTAYFKRSTEGQDDLNKVLAIATALFQTLLKILEPLGKALFKAISEPKKAFNDFLELIKPITDKLKEIFENPVQSIKQFGQLIIDNFLNRFKAVGVAVTGLIKIFKGDFKAGLKDLGNASIQVVTGVTNGIDKIVTVTKAAAKILADIAAKAAADAAKGIALGLKIAALEAKIRKDKIADVIDDSKTELDVTKLLVEAKDKLKFSDEQRFEALRKANKELEDQLEGDLQLTQEQIDLVDLQIQQQGKTYELLEARAHLEAEFNNQQTAFFTARKNRQKQEIALIQEIDKETQDKIKREADAERNLNNFLVNGSIEANKQILADERSTFEQRSDAIHGIAEDQEKLAAAVRDQAIAAAKEDALSRINLDDDTLTKIYNNESISINARIAQERAAKEELLGSDQAYVNQRILISDQYFAAVDKSNDEAAQSTNDNIFLRLERDFKQLDATVKTGSADQQDELNQAYLDGNATAAQVLKDRQIIQIKAQEDSLNAQIDYLQKYRDQLKALGFDTLQIDQQIAEARQAISDNQANRSIEGFKKVKDASINLAQEALSAAQQIFAAQTQARVDSLNAQLDAESAQKDKSIAIAGDDAQAKAFIEAAFAQKQKEIQRQLAAEKRKQAIFDKATALTQAGINVALGVTAALSELPPFSFILAALVGAAGALQIAAIASKPIPQFYTGTTDSPEGYAWLGERGREIVREPGKKPYLADRPMLKYLKRHSVVHDNASTESLLNDATMFGDGFGMPEQLKGSFDNARIRAEIHSDSGRVAEAIDQSKKEIVQAIKGMPQDAYDEHGYRRYEISEGLRIVRLDKRYKLQ